MPETLKFTIHYILIFYLSIFVSVHLHKACQEIRYGGIYFCGDSEFSWWEGTGIHWGIPPILQNYLTMSWPLLSQQIHLWPPRPPAVPILPSIITKDILWHHISYRYTNTPHILLHFRVFSSQQVRNIFWLPCTRNQCIGRCFKS